MTAQAETRRFEAEAQELLGLMIHSLYTQKDIFLRELISNASDALDKLRHAALTDGSLLAEDETLAIRLEADKDAGTLSIIDNGIGMTRDEMVENLGTIARSGTRRFLEELKAANAEQAPELIGQFGVGFYSSFMVADEVVVESRKAGAAQGARWSSRADGEYTLEDADVAERGTRITLHLKPLDKKDKDAQNFLEEWTLRSIVKQYSDFVEYPIQMDVERDEPVLDDEGKPKPGKTTKVVKTETLNSMKPLWLRDKQSIKNEEHADFYRHITHDWNEPYAKIHFTAESPVEYTALLYLPKQRPMEWMEGPTRESRLSLYARRVLIMPECEDLLPPWLRFVRGVVDCSDLPLNVSRQTLQANPVTAKMRKHLVSKLLRTFGEKLKKDREGYGAFFGAFGPILKEGIYQGDDDKNRISKVCLFASTHGDELTTLSEYVERMADDQDAIYYITGLDKETLAKSPHLEAYRAKGHEVLVLSDPVDEWMLQKLPTFEEKPLKAIHKGDAGLETEDDKKAREKKQEESKDLLEAMQKQLDEWVGEVRFSSRLTDSPAVLVSPEGSMGPAMERVMREMDKNLPGMRRILELNPDHALVARLEAWHDEEPEGERFVDYTDLLHGQALVREGEQPPDPARFASLVTALMLQAAES